MLFMLDQFLLEPKIPFCQFATVTIQGTWNGLRFTGTERPTDRIIPLWPNKAIFIQLSLIVKKCQRGPFDRQLNSGGARFGRKLSHIRGEWVVY